MKRLFEVARVEGVRVYVHWSVLLIGALVLMSALRRPFVTLVALLAYISVLLIHELGHAIAARRKGCAVWSIELYPLHGLTRYETPRSPMDASIIAWGGVAAQAVVALPLIAWVIAFGYTRLEAFNAVLALLGFFSAAVVLLNLLPIPHLDGPKAWPLVPMLLNRVRDRRSRRKKRGWAA